jgi:hypothetical protein
VALARLVATTKELAELQTELDAYGARDPVKVEEKRRATVLAREAALLHTGLGLSIHPPPTPSAFASGGGYGACRTVERRNADESDASHYSVLISLFTRQHNIEPQDIRSCLGVEPDCEDLC